MSVVLKLQLGMIVLVSCVSLYMTVCTADLIIGEILEKKYLFYPLIHFQCFCDYTVNVIDQRMTPTPTRTYNFYKCWKHTKECLSWILIADFNNLTPYCANSYAKDLRVLTLMDKGWYLEYAKQRSAEARNGHRHRGATATRRT